MNIVRRHFHMLALSTLVAAAPFGAAQAQTVEAALERFGALVEGLGAKIEWQSADISGNDAVLVGVTAGTDDTMVPIGNVVLTGISQVDNGYSVESITLDSYRIDDGAGSSFSLTGFEIGGVLLPDDDALDGYGGFMFYETGSVENLVFTAQGKDVFTMSDLHYEGTAPVDGAPMEFEGAAESFTIDLSVIDDANQQAVLTALGYQQLQGYFEISGSWQPTDGRLTMSQYDMTVVDAGTLGISIDLGGYTPDFIKALRDLQQQMAANPDGDSSAQGLAMLGLMQQLSFHGAEISFTDDSLTNKVAEFVGQMQGMSAADIKNMGKAALPFVLAQLGNPDLTSSATQAVSKFLDDPQVLRITAAPAEPVPFALIMAEGMSAPQGLINTLAVKVTAND